MVTYKDIESANKAIVTTDIKGKDYAEVNQRIKAFRMVYPEGFIGTTIYSLENGVCVIRAEVGYYAEDGSPIPLGSGTAYEKEGSTFINKTSYIENCETSAVGRALGMAGFGIDTSIASAEEVQNAIANQEQPKKKTPNKDKNTAVPEGDVKPESEMTQPTEKIDGNKVKAIRARLKAAAEKGKVMTEDAVCRTLKISSGKIEDMTEGEFRRFCELMEKYGL